MRLDRVFCFLKCPSHSRHLQTRCPSWERNDERLEAKAAMKISSVLPFTSHFYILLEGARRGNDECAVFAMDRLQVENAYQNNNYIITIVYFASCFLRLQAEQTPRTHQKIWTNLGDNKSVSITGFAWRMGRISCPRPSAYNPKRSLRLGIWFQKWTTHWPSQRVRTSDS